MGKPQAISQISEVDNEVRERIKTPYTLPWADLSFDNCEID